jgi:hypothetical protein
VFFQEERKEFSVGTTVISLPKCSFKVNENKVFKGIFYRFSKKMTKGK